MSAPVIFWFRRDLRLRDNPALAAAAAAGDGHVLALFIVDPVFSEPAGPTRVTYLRATLASLDDSLEGALCVKRGSPVEVLDALCHSSGATRVFAARDFAPKGAERDDLVASTLAAKGITLEFIGSPYVVDPGTVLTKTGTPCRVFSAFRRGWELERVAAPVAAPSGVTWWRDTSEGLSAFDGVASTRRPWYFADLPDDVAPSLPEAGEDAAHEALASFLAVVDDYDEGRNFPGVAGTSRLSGYLRFGALHPRQVLAALSSGSKGEAVFRSEICWREFYADVLFHQPDSVWRVLQPSLAQLRVDTDDAARERFARWARGETGYPIVDAGMRQLLEEGWMHNRVRMIAASFLVKHLHLDWRWGAKWFMWRLYDGDVASNQHGWQWTAGTGTDAAPFHRIFNPTLQAERFDPSGAYVHRWVDELRAVPAPECLQPGGGGGLLAASYVAPMIDATTERNEALARFAEARELARASS